MSSEMKWFCACQMRLGRKISIESADSNPQPLALQIAPRIGEQHGSDDAQGEEAHRPLGEHAEADGRANRHPPACICRSSAAEPRSTRPVPTRAHRRPRTASAAPAPRQYGTTATAATSCAPRRPPISRAINPAALQQSAIATLAKKRKPRIEVPNRMSEIRPKNGVTGGYAT